MATDRTVLVRLKANVGDFVAGMSLARAAVRGITSEIDTSNDRVAWLTQGILALAPAVVPLGAAAVPIFAGLAAQMTLAAGSAAVLALGMNGIGDALKAVDEYQLEPTVENLQKMQMELEKMGPAGADFVKFLDSIEPQLRTLQMVAREGMLPGFEEGISKLMRNMPQARRLIGDTAEALGQLAGEAGKGLSGQAFSDFFEYLEQNAKPLLLDMGRTFGNFMEGLANMMVGFAPLTTQFSAGLLNMSRSFSDWSHGLEDDSSFQGFLRAIEEAIPKALAFGAALTDAFVALVAAAAPVGDIMLPALTLFLDLITTIAETPLGPLFIGAAAAMSIYGRAVALASVSTGKLVGNVFGLVKPSLAASAGVRTLAADLAILSRSATSVQAPVKGFIGPLTQGQAAMARMRETARGLGKTAGLVAGFALATSGIADGMGLSNTASLALMGTIAGPWGAAIGGGIGLTMDLAAANNDLEDAVTNANLALMSNDVDQMKVRYEELGDQIKETAENAKVGLGQDISGPGDVIDALGAQWSNLSGQTDEAKEKFSELGDAIGHTVNDVGLFSTGVLDAANSVEQLSAALAELQGWLDKRAAIRDYRDSLRELAKGIKDGFGREDIENIDAVGENIIKVANSIKDPALRQQFMVGAMNSLNDLAEKAAPEAREQIQRLIDKFAELGLAKVTPRVDADTQKAEDAFERSRRSMSDLDHATAKPTVGGDDNPWKAIYGGTKRDLANLNKSKGKPKVDGDDNPWKAIYGGTKRDLANLDRSKTTAHIGGDGSGALNAIANVNRALAAMNAYKTITIAVNRVTGGLTSAEGGLIQGPGGPTDDVIPAWLSNREYVVKAAAVEKYGVAMMHAINGMRFAQGGQARRDDGTEKVKHGTIISTEAIAHLLAGAENVAQALKILNVALEKAQKAVDRDRQARDDVAAMMDSLSSSVQSQLRSDIFAKPTNPWAAAGGSATDILNADTADAEEFARLIESLSSKGLKGAALAEVAGGGVPRLRVYDAMAATDLAAYAAAYERREKALQVAGTTTGQAAYGGDYALWDDKLSQQVQKLRDIEKAIKAMDRENQKGHKKTSDSKNGDDKPARARRKARRT